MLGITRMVTFEDGNKMARAFVSIGSLPTDADIESVASELFGAMPCDGLFSLEFLDIGPDGLFAPGLSTLETVPMEDLALRQSKELFSRLKFNAMELSSKMTFLANLYESDEQQPAVDGLWTHL